MPKDELANLFESLINITSLKVKIQDNLETVDVDVDIEFIDKMARMENEEFIDVDDLDTLFNKKSSI